ncbi:hypothetical protein [Palaeococcus sp. (in: euryarchaeotes)]
MDINDHGISKTLEKPQTRNKALKNFRIPKNLIYPGNTCKRSPGFFHSKTSKKLVTKFKKTCNNTLNNNKKLLKTSKPEKNPNS